MNRKTKHRYSSCIELTARTRVYHHRPGRIETFIETTESLTMTSEGAPTPDSSLSSSVGGKSVPSSVNVPGSSRSSNHGGRKGHQTNSNQVDRLFKNDGTDLGMMSKTTNNSLSHVYISSGTLYGLRSELEHVGQTDRPFANSQ